MNESMGTIDVIIGIMAALGVVVLLIVFVLVVKKVFSKDTE
jgi:cbb3-type cytochrome oxidase subunit 3